jgi:hypothetical protein
MFALHCSARAPVAMHTGTRQGDSQREICRYIF